MPALTGGHGAQPAQRRGRRAAQPERPPLDRPGHASGSVAAPYYAYNHSACVVSYPGCRTGSSSITGLAFYQGGSYPAT